MPPKKKSEKEEKEKEVELLGPLAHTLIILGMTITLTLAFTGLLGILVLLGAHRACGGHWPRVALAISLPLPAFRLLNGLLATGSWAEDLCAFWLLHGRPT